ncbi:hypothetical protein EYZ11_001281 [Aspergillus tanneri]|uniref:RRM domain-containing protein n=1 Tax=Aspergillus tanneri TaxID=1220188 RepID=A0A4S3JV33_9EURO|nr:uncharacterized protein ATNIH1004_007136 [Aspergillus tanneri]KAA8645717.1 hypothetical protein ATNIH1004_007136 [Aspergillus tanneri]THC99282.1 hypothetical protein EYZ11_001281 [Aspergillus tanneri]
MATEDDNFDIDIYGDGGGYNANEQGDYKHDDETKHDDSELILDAPENTHNGGPPQGDSTIEVNARQDNTESINANGGHVTHSEVSQQQAPKENPAPPQGVKRKEHDDRPTDPDATAALLISDLYWWTTDDDIRGWIREAECEDELKDVTFSEHKVNGKSKGQAFIEFSSLQASTATKHKIESFSLSGQSGRKYTVNYTNPQPNPFRTLPKDAPMRKDNQARSMSGGFNAPNQNMNFGMNNMAGGFRGGRGGSFNRGAMGNNIGNFGNRNFQNPMGGFQNQMGGGFPSNPMGGMQNYGFNNRGGMMGGGMRGGPGGMRGRGGGMAGPNMMGMPAMNPMGGMGMNPMSGGMNPMMGGGMGGNMGMQGKGGFQGPNPAFNQGFFSPNQGVGDGSWNPHGAKRSRQE